MLKQKYFLTGIFILSAERQPIKLAWRKIVWLLKKDFVAPNRLGWRTVCLKDDGRNIHSQNIEIAEVQKPQFIIDKLTDLIKVEKKRL